MQLLITPLAAFDLEEIGDYIAQDNPNRALGEDGTNDGHGTWLGL
jgi:plasmid stabilization system protein ParE